MKNFFQKQREIMAILAYASLLFALYFWVILPIISGINNTRDQIQGDSLKQESSRKKLGELPRARQQFESIGQADDMGSILLDKDKAVLLIERLEKVASDCDDKITITAQDESAQKSSVVTAGKPDDSVQASLPSSDYLKLKITLVGDYNSIVKFIDTLEKFEYYSDVINIQIDKKDQPVQSSQASVGTGMVLDPFAPNDIKKTNIDSSKSPLAASLDVVFYTKKQ